MKLEILCALLTDVKVEVRRAVAKLDGQLLPAVHLADVVAVDGDARVGDVLHELAASLGDREEPHAIRREHLLRGELQPHRAVSRNEHVTALQCRHLERRVDVHLKCHFRNRKLAQVDKDTLKLDGFISTIIPTKNVISCGRLLSNLSLLQLGNRPHEAKMEQTAC